MKRKAAALGDGLEPLPNHEYIGLRGMSNLGQTCFLNSICQALCHTPLFRNYFLSECHTPRTCLTAQGDQVCVACEVDALLNALYNGDRTAFVPHRFLYAFWKQGLDADGRGADGGGTCALAGYEQQDAHEFFGALLDALKAHDASLCSAPGESGVVRHCFPGLLRSDLCCSVCGTVSSTTEEFTALSLEIDEAITADRSGTSTLQRCLAVFTQRETLSEPVACASCRQHQSCSKRLALARLPPVLVLHLKRFNHNRAAKQKVKKIENFVSFPLCDLDMEPYTADGVGGCQYDLAAVVEHHGDNTCLSGHYTAYIRHNWGPLAPPPPSPGPDPGLNPAAQTPPKAQKDQWYLFDDACIYHATPEEVLRSEAYLLFYVQQRLLYDPAG